MTALAFVVVVAIVTIAVVAITHTPAADDDEDGWPRVPDEQNAPHRRRTTQGTGMGPVGPVQGGREAMSATDTIADLRRELTKAHDTLEVVQRHLAAVAEGNAALHCADRVIYSPLHAKVEATLNGVRMALMVSNRDPSKDVL